jgi:hypothetical protein
MELWGEDPVHPTPAAYQVLANKLVAMVDDMLAESASPSPVTTNNNKKRGRPQGALVRELRASGQAPDPCRPGQ